LVDFPEGYLSQDFSITRTFIYDFLRMGSLKRNVQLW